MMKLISSAVAAVLVTASEAQLFLASTASKGSAAPDPKAWEPLKDLLDQWKFTDNFAVAVGDAEHGRLFVYEHGNFSMHTQVETASTSKWPSAMMIAGLVNDGHIKSLDDPVSSYLSWWTKDQADARSRVTIRHLLTFTSGFGDGHPGDLGAGDSISAQHRASQHFAPTVKVPRASACDEDGDVTACAKEIYSTVKMIGEPGQVYSYNSNHLQLAGAAAVAITGMTIKQVIQKYLFDVYGFTESEYPGSNPDLATALRTTGADYERFLLGLLKFSHLPKQIIDESEKDATPFMSDDYTLYGDYGFGHFLFCFDSVDGMTKECKDAKCHIDPGAFGFFPLIDRRLGYYFEVVAYESGNYYPRSGIPEYLAQAIKPLVDAIITGKDVSDTAAHHYPGFNSLSLMDVNYISGCYINPSSCASSEILEFRV